MHKLRDECSTPFSHGTQVADCSRSAGSSETFCADPGFWELWAHATHRDLRTNGSSNRVFVRMGPILVGLAPMLGFVGQKQSIKIIFKRGTHAGSPPIGCCDSRYPRFWSKTMDFACHGDLENETYFSASKLGLSYSFFYLSSKNFLITFWRIFFLIKGFVLKSPQKCSLPPFGQRFFLTDFLYFRLSENFLKTSKIFLKLASKKVRIKKLYIVKRLR